MLDIGQLKDLREKTLLDRAPHHGSQTGDDLVVVHIQLVHQSDDARLLRGQVILPYLFTEDVGVLKDVSEQVSTLAEGVLVDLWFLLKEKRDDEVADPG